MAWGLVVGVFTAVVGLVVAVWCYYAYRFTYWRSRGISHPMPWPVVGNFNTFFTKKKGMQGIIESLEPYRDTGYCGFYMGASPVLATWDPEMAKQVLCKDFTSFHDRGLPYSESDPLSAHLFNLGGTKWRNLRNKLTPTFTSGKLKLMLPLIRDVGDELSAIVTEKARLSVSSGGDGEVDMQPLLARYATDVIGSCAFGVQCHCLRDSNNQFQLMSERVTAPSLAQLLRFAVDNLHPKVAGLIPLKWLFPEVTTFFLDMMRDTVEYREKHPEVERHDFVHLMMQLRDKDFAHDDPENHVDLSNPSNMAAQAFIFFIAGLDNMSNTVGYCLNRLAGDQALQERVAAEIRDVLKQHDDVLSYEALKAMDLVDRVMMEGLRLWPAIGFLFRKCNAATRVGDVLVEEGVAVMVLSGVMQVDENIFPDPKRFDPDRHTAEGKAARHPYAFLPFGEGPRVCIAERFAKLEIKLSIAKLVRDFVLSPGPNFEHEVVMHPKSFLPKPKNGFRFRVQPRPRSED